MISLKRNNKLELTEAKGIREQESSIYKANQESDFKLSRSKFEDYLSCPRCFFLDRCRGLVAPQIPKFTLNETTDHLLKIEFDECRKNQQPHRLFLENGLEHLVPYQHEQMDKWRNALRGGLMAKFEDTNIVLSGGIDDLWYDTNTKEIIVCDYKSQANSHEVEAESYLSSGWHQGYKNQMDFYNYLLNLMGFKTADTSYFYVVNANRAANGFHSKLEFTETLIPYKHDFSWIPEKVREMIHCMNQDKVPANNPACMNCAYTKQVFKLAKIKGGINENF